MAGRRGRDMIVEDVSDDYSQDEEEAIEENQIEEEDERSISSEGDGDDLYNNIEGDYKNVPELDVYEADGINDEEDFDELDPHQRRLADEEIEERNYIQNANQRRIPAALKEFDLNDEEEDDEDVNQRLLRRRQFLEEHDLYDSGDEQIEEEEDKDQREYDKYIDKEQAKGKLSNWIKEELTVRYIRRSFRKFLTQYKDQSIDMILQRLIKQNITIQQFS